MLGAGRDARRASLRMGSREESAHPGPFCRRSYVHTLILVNFESPPGDSHGLIVHRPLEATADKTLASIGGVHHRIIKIHSKRYAWFAGEVVCIKVE